MRIWSRQSINPYRRNIQVNYLYTFFQSFDLTQGFWMIYLASKGMSLVQLGILEGVFHVTSLIMETPTGAIADIFGRKTSRILGRVFLTANILLTFFGTSFSHFLLSFIFCAIGWNLESGAGDALVYDSLAETKEEERYMKVKGKLEAIYQIAQASAMMIGGVIAVQSYGKLYLGQILILASAISVAMLLKETTVNRPINQNGGFASAIKEQYTGSFSVLKGNHRLIYLIGLVNGLSIFTTTAFYYMQIYCQINGVREGAMGIILALSAVTGALGGIFSSRIESRVQEKTLLTMLPILFMVLLWAMVFFQSAIVAFVLIGFVDSLMYVVYSDYINRLLPSDKRATLLSFSSMIFSLFMIILFPLFGWIGDQLSLSWAFAVMAIASTVLAITNLFLLRFDEGQPESQLFH